MKTENPSIGPAAGAPPNYLALPWPARCHDLRHPANEWLALSRISDDELVARWDEALNFTWELNRDYPRESNHLVREALGSQMGSRFRLAVRVRPFAERRAV